MSEMPPLPAGFKLDSQNSQTPALPPGFTLDSAVAAPELSDSDFAQIKSMGFNGTKDDFLQQAAKDATRPKRSFFNKLLEVPVGAAETAMNFGSSIPATVLGGLAGVGQGAKNVISPGMPAGDRVLRIRDALTYSPRSDAGQTLTQIAQYPFQKFGELADYSGDIASQGVHKLGASPEVAASAGSLTNTAIQALPAIFLRGRTAAAPLESTAQAAARAEHYVRTNTALDWNTLSDKTKQTLTTIAQDSKNLDYLDPKAIERQSRLEALNIPATRGQITRDLPQLTREENIAKSDAGQPIRDINAAQDTRLHELVDKLRSDTGAQAETRQAVGTSIQDAARSKLNYLKSESAKAYKFAESTGALLEPVDVTPLRDWLKNPINRRNTSSLEGAIDDFEKGGKVSINELEQIRQEQSAISKSGDKSAHYAGEAVSVIDKILEDSGSSAYKNARQSYKSMKDEFDRQGRVAKLVDEKGYTTDRAVALEDTFDNIVLKGSAEDIAKVKKSLTTGGSTETKVKGAQAWKDLQGATLDYLKEKAAGKRAIVGEQNQLQFNSTFRDAFNELEKDGKIEAIFSPQQARMLRQINNAVGDVRTKPAGRIAGSDTAPRILSMLEKISKLPAVGNIISGTVKAGMKLNELGQESKDASQAVTAPLDEAATEAANALKKKQVRNRLRGAEGAATATEGRP